MKLVAATNNKKKLKELKRILSSLNIEVVSLSEIGLEIEPEETGATFAQNAKIKAMAVFQACGLPTVADDSGLAVDYLNGAPGVYSARYAGEDATDDMRIDKLLEELQGVPEEKRTARFVSAICCILSENEVIETLGTCEGRIGFEKKGTNGFGYDPIFMVDGVSYSQMTDLQKDEISHRGKALRELYIALNNYLRSNHIVNK